MGNVFTDPFGIKQAQEKANEEAARQAEAARAEQRRIEEKFGLTEAEKERSTRTAALEKSQQSELERRAGISGEDLLREAGPVTRQVLDQIAARQGKTSEQLFIEEGGRPAQLLLESISQPGVVSTFEPELELALQEVQKSLGRRGLTSQNVPGDIGLESLGRAGVDLAIKGARERLTQQRDLANTLFNVAAGNRAEAGAVGERALSESGTARQNLNAFLSNLQNLDQASRTRAANVGVNAFNTAQPIVSRFGEVPINVAGFEAGRRAQTQEDIIGGLSNIGLGLATGGASVPFQAATSVASERQKARTEEDPLDSLLAFTGSPRRISGSVSSDKLYF